MAINRYKEAMEAAVVVAYPASITEAGIWVMTAAVAEISVHPVKCVKN